MKKSDREIKLYQDFILEYGKELKSKITDTYSFRDDLLRNKFRTDEPTQEKARKNVIPEYLPTILLYIY